VNPKWHAQVPVAASYDPFPPQNCVCVAQSLPSQPCAQRPQSAPAQWPLQAQLPSPSLPALQVPWPLHGCVCPPAHSTEHAAPAHPEAHVHVPVAASATPLPLHVTSSWNAHDPAGFHPGAHASQAPPTPALAHPRAHSQVHEAGCAPPAPDVARNPDTPTALRSHVRAVWARHCPLDAALPSEQRPPQSSSSVQGDGGVEQSAPLQWPPHAQLPSLRAAPCPLHVVAAWCSHRAPTQPGAHRSHAEPSHPSPHAHAPSAPAVPWPEHVVASEKAHCRCPAPSHPGSHAHAPPASTVPRPWHVVPSECSQPAPSQPGSHAHAPSPKRPRPQAPWPLHVRPSVAGHAPAQSGPHALGSAHSATSQRGPVKPVVGSQSHAPDSSTVPRPLHVEASAKRHASAPAPSHPSAQRSQLCPVHPCEHAHAHVAFWRLCSTPRADGVARWPLTLVACPLQSSATVHGTGGASHASPLQPSAQTHRQLAACAPPAPLVARKPTARVACPPQSSATVHGTGSTEQSVPDQPSLHAHAHVPGWSLGSPSTARWPLTLAARPPQSTTIVHGSGGALQSAPDQPSPHRHEPSARAAPWPLQVASAWCWQSLPSQPASHEAQAGPVHRPWQAHAPLASTTPWPEQSVEAWN
jgi:hypothetical protein